MKKARLDNWTLGNCHLDGPGTMCLFGEVYDHPDFPDGRGVVTSVIAEIDLINKEAKTAHTHYTLLKHSPKVLEKYRATNKNIAPFFHVYENPQPNQEPDS